jgi:hypothetical protein
MGVSRRIYIGWYVKVWLPKEKTEALTKKCPNCDRFGYHVFCPVCGNELQPIEIEKLQHPYDYLERVFPDEGCEAYFTYKHPGGNTTNTSGFIVYVPSRKGMNGFHLDEYEFEQKLDYTYIGVTHPAWEKLIKQLEADGIKHELKCGVINSYG